MNFEKNDLVLLTGIVCPGAIGKITDIINDFCYVQFISPWRGYIGCTVSVKDIKKISNKLKTFL